MSNLALLKLRDYLTVYEAGAYLVKTVGAEDKYHFAHISMLVNEGKLNLYLKPDAFHENKKPWIDYDPELLGNDCQLRGEQKFVSVYLDSCEYTVYVNAGAEITGNVFAGRDVSVLTCAGNDTEGIARAAALENTLLTNRVSIIPNTLYQSDEDGESFFYIKRKEIDLLIASTQDTYEPEKEKHLKEINELNAKIKALEDNNSELKTQLNTKLKPAKSQLLVIARAYELYSKGKESTHTKAAFNAELRDDNYLHGLSERTINGLLSEAANALDQERKRKQ